MKALIILLLSCASLFARETLIPLKSGDTNMVSYGLFCVVSDWRDTTNAPAGSSLVLMLRNTGAKWIDLESVTADDFEFKDAKGQERKIYLWTQSPRGMGLGDDTVMHLIVDRPGDAPQPWTLHFRSKKALVPIELTITDIKPQKQSAQRALTPAEIDAIPVGLESEANQSDIVVSAPAPTGPRFSTKEAMQQRRRDHKIDDLLYEMRRANDLAEESLSQQELQNAGRLLIEQQRALDNFVFDMKWTAYQHKVEDLQSPNSENEWVLRYNGFDRKWHYAPSDAQLKYNPFERQWEFVPAN